MHNSGCCTLYCCLISGPPSSCFVELTCSALQARSTAPWITNVSCLCRTVRLCTCGKRERVKLWISKLQGVLLPFLINDGLFAHSLLQSLLTIVLCEVFIKTVVWVLVVGCFGVRVVKEEIVDELVVVSDVLFNSLVLMNALRRLSNSPSIGMSCSQLYSSLIIEPVKVWAMHLHVRVGFSGWDLRSRLRLQQILDDRNYRIILVRLFADLIRDSPIRLLVILKLMWLIVTDRGILVQVHLQLQKVLGSLLLHHLRLK